MEPDGHGIGCGHASFVELLFAVLLPVLGLGMAVASGMAMRGNAAFS